MTVNYKNPAIQELLDASSDHEFALSFPLPGRIFGFHAQQAIEKLLKVLILATCANHDYTHDIEILVESATRLGETLPRVEFPMNDLTDFAVEFRYMTPRALTPTERDQIRDTVRILREHVHTRLVALNA